MREYALLMYAGMRLVTVFHELRYGKTSKIHVTKSRINEELDTLRHKEPELAAQLSRWQRLDKSEQDEIFYDFLRLALPKEMVNWGGYTMTFAMAVEKYCKRDELPETES